MPTILRGDEYLALPRESATWLLKPLLPSGGAMTVYGDPKVGKSYAALQLALALSGSESHWLEFPVIASGLVAYIQLDTPRSLWASRLEQLQSVGVAIHTLHLADRGTLDTWPFDILIPSHFSLLSESLKPLNPIAVIIDTLREVHSGDENDSTTMRNVIASLVAATQPAALILISHARKPNGELPPDLMTDQRGSSYVVGRMDAIARFTKKRLYYSGRAIEEGYLTINRLDNGFWEVDNSEWSIHIKAVLSDPSLSSLRQRAASLSTRTGKREEACRSALRRLGERVESPGGSPKRP